MEDELNYCATTLLSLLREHGPLTASVLRSLSKFSYDDVHSSLRLLTNLDLVSRVVPPRKFNPVYVAGLLDRLALEAADADA